MDSKIHMGNLVEEIVRKKKKVIAGLAEDVHTSRSNIYSIFKRKRVHKEMLERLSHALDYDFTQHLESDSFDEDNKTNIRIIVDIQIRNENVPDFVNNTIRSLNEFEDRMSVSYYKNEKLFQIKTQQEEVVITKIG